MMAVRTRGLRTLKGAISMGLDRVRTSGASDGTHRESQSIEQNRRSQLVRSKIVTYRDSYLDYLLWMRSSAARLAEDQKLALLGPDPRMAAPVLSLQSDDWIWRDNELLEQVMRALASLSMAAVRGESDPTALASRCCEAWANTQATQRLTEI